MGYSRHNKEYDLTPRYPAFTALEPVEVVYEAAELTDRPPLPEAPGLSEVWQKATHTAQSKYPASPNYHDTVIRQRKVRIPYLLLRANVADGSDALSVAKNTNGTNHAKRMLEFLGHGILPSVIGLDAEKEGGVDTDRVSTVVGIAVDAARTFGDVDQVALLDKAYTKWQTATGLAELANLVETE